MTYPLIVYSEFNFGGKIIRGRVNYRKTGPWYDWVDCKWVGSDLPCPFEVHGYFYDENNVPFAFGYSVCDQNVSEKKKSKGLFEHWRLEKDPRVVECRAFVSKRLCFRIPEVCIKDCQLSERKSNLIIAVKDRHSCWADMFLDGSLLKGI